MNGRCMALPQGSSPREATAAAAPDAFRQSMLRRWWQRSRTAPVAILVTLALLLWYAAALPMNRVLTANLLTEQASLTERARVSWSLQRPILPAPHQVVQTFHKEVFATPLWRAVPGQPDARMLNPRNLLTHVLVTASAALTGFAIGTLIGIALAVAIVHVRVLRLSLMPWLVASQAVPILAVAPIVIVIMGALGLTGLLPKALISAYLCFFPITIGMVKGLQSPERLQLELLSTYSASRREVFWLLRLPAAMPMLWASCKVAMAISLVGAIIAELPTGATAGIGARLLSGSYYGQTLQIWSALLAAGITAALLVGAIDALARLAARMLGQPRTSGRRP